jgi:zinc transporter ZupT
MKRNIETKGRVLRAGTGVATILAAIVGYFLNAPILLDGLLVAFGGFMIFQGVSGWCLARACGMKTKY